MCRYIKTLVCLLVCIVPLNLFCVSKVVIWGHKLHSHTHSYIHAAFYKAFKKMGYPVYWFDNSDDVKGFDFTDALFITEGQVDARIPIRDDCYYVAHNCSLEKYMNLPQENWIVLQVYTDDVLQRSGCKKVANCIYYDVPNKTLYMPWATDLLPEEINNLKQKLPSIKKSRDIFWVGTIGGGTFGNQKEIAPFEKASKKSKVSFRKLSGISEKEAIKAIQTSYMAPTIVGTWQKEKGYIPCRIFKNVSYGQLGLTNSYRVYELFDKKIVYNPDEYKLFYDAKDRLKTITKDEILELMDFVRDNHTYINRIDQILDFFEKVKESC